MSNPHAPDPPPFPLTRRAFLAGSVGSLVLAADGLAAAPPDPIGHATSLGIPGPFPGRVIQVSHPGSVVNGAVQREAVRAMAQRGMCELTGDSDPRAAWRRLFAPGDTVGIKVSSVGAPLAMSSLALVHEVVEGLESAGVRAEDVIVFDRYRTHFERAAYAGHLPSGVRWGTVTERYDEAQLAVDGYDPDVYREVDLVHATHHDPADPRARRSHVCLIATRTVAKIVNLPVLKDHSYAGVTLSLKNLSHGLVNNVSRSHATPSTNACATFIPAIVSLPVIRSKVVLNILDGTHGVFDGGPFASAATTWEHRTLYFATDPVSLDHIGWEAIDAKRGEMHLPPVAEARIAPMRTENSALRAYRQPQHIAFAGALGLGVFERDRITLERIELSA